MLHAIDGYILEKGRERTITVTKPKKTSKGDLQKQNAMCILSFLDDSSKEWDFDVSRISADKAILHSLILLKNPKPFEIVLNACARQPSKHLHKAVNCLITVRDDAKFTPFLNAVKNEKHHAVILMLRYQNILHFDSLETTPMFSLTALHYAAKSKDAKLMSILLNDKRLQANIDIEDGCSFTAMHYAALYLPHHGMEMLMLLKQNKADFTKQNYAGSTSLDIIKFDSKISNASDIIENLQRPNILDKLKAHAKYLKGAHRVNADTIMLG